MYEGSFVQGNMHGIGSLTTSSEKFMGTFVSGKRQGPGYLILPSGAISVEYDKDKLVS